MPKQSGLGDRLFVGGNDVSGDVGSLSRIGGGVALLEVTGIDKSGFERLGGIRDGSIEFSGFFNDSPTQLHQTLRALPTADVGVTYCRGTVMGNPAAALIAKQVNYDLTRGEDGSLTVDSQALADGFGLEWGNQLTTGLRTDSSILATPAWDSTLATTNFGGTLVVQCQAYTGTGTLVRVQTSPDGTTWTDLPGPSSGNTQVTVSAPGAYRVQSNSTSAVQRYIRTIMGGGVPGPMTWQAMFIRNETVVVY